MKELTFFVPGIPRPQGSKRHVGNGRMIEANKEVYTWRDTVAAYAIQHWGRHWGAEGKQPFLGALKADLLFELPKGPSVTRHNPAVKPDLDKLTRAVFDAIEAAGLVANDSQFCDLHAAKVYGTHRTGVTIKISYL